MATERVVYSADADREPVSVSLYPSHAAGVLEAACAKFGVLPDNVDKYFFLAWEGADGGGVLPLAREQQIPCLPPGDRLVIRRRTVQAASERHLLNDDGAVRLLYDEAMWRVETEELCPDAETSDRLDQYSDPAFTVHRQYLELVQAVPGYDSISLRACQAKLRFTTEEDKVFHEEELGHINPTLTQEGVRFNAHVWSWQKIRQWSIPPQALAPVAPGTTQAFSIQLLPGLDADQWRGATYVWLQLRTPEAQLWLHSINRVVGELKQALDGPQWPELKQQEATVSDQSGVFKVFNTLFQGSRSNTDFTGW
eukprot:m.405421 g.405421  ORF g.405421 m.405421 type:complete len:310 (+) comp20132_c0_seq4:915-1844(+)